MTRLESYKVGAEFAATMFLADAEFVEQHPEDNPLSLALNELEFLTSEVRILRDYAAYAYRTQSKQPATNGG